MSLNFKDKLLLFFMDFCYNFVINGWIAKRNGQDLLGDETIGKEQTEFDLDLKINY